MKKRVLSLALAAAMALGLGVPALAYTTPDFSDLPPDNWAYGPVMRMADAGVIKGTGEGAFSPEMKVTMAQFVALVGRVVFPGIQVVGEGKNWYVPYLDAAYGDGLLAGAQVDVSNPETEISRYDMAVILRAAAKKLGKNETLAPQSQVTDYDTIPEMYTEAVLAVYGMGLITGDEAGRFNGQNTMQRNELATVIDRLVAMESTIEKPPAKPKVYHVSKCVSPEYPKPYDRGVGHSFIDKSFPIQIRYTQDGGETFTVLTEGNTSIFAGKNYYTEHLEFDIEETLLEKGQVYVSGEVDYEGVHYATHDRRTDGRAEIVPLDVVSEANRPIGSINTEFVPPATGYQRTVTISASYSVAGKKVSSHCVAQCRYYPDPENATPGGGILLGEAPMVAEPGSTLMEYEIKFKIDTLDYMKLEDRPNYKVELWDMDNGTVIWESDVTTLRKVEPGGRAFHAQ